MDDLIARIRAMIQAWESVGQHEHAQHLRRQMWELLREAIKARRG